jgi:hypothetical protein
MQLLSATTPTSPLPIAAAHHPSHLRKLRVLILQSGATPPATANDSTTDAQADTRKSASGHTTVSLLLDKEARVQALLRDALERARKVGDELRVRLAKMRRPDDAGVSVPRLRLWGRNGEAKRPGENYHVCISLLAPRELESLTTRVFFTKTKPSSDLLSAYSLPIPGDETSVEQCIEDIRNRQLTSYLSLPALPTVLESAPSPNTPRPSDLHSPAHKHAPLTPPRTPAHRGLPEPSGRRSSHIRKSHGRVSFMSPLGKERAGTRKSARFKAVGRPSLARAKEKIEEEEEACEISRVSQLVTCTRRRTGADRQ